MTCAACRGGNSKLLRGPSAASIFLASVLQQICFPICRLPGQVLEREGEYYQLWGAGSPSHVEPTWSPRGAHVKHMGETARRTMTQTQFSRHFSTCIGPVLLDWIERNLRRVLPLLLVQILCVCLPFKFACRPANDKPISVKVLTVKACFLPAFAALGANGSESIQRRVW